MWCLFLVCCAAIAPVLAAAPLLTVEEARNSADDAVQYLVQLNEELADHYFHTGTWDKAVVVLDHITILEPRGTDAYASAAWLLWSTGKIDAAMDFYHRMVAANPKDPEAYYIVGNMFFNRRQYVDALPWLEQAVALGLGSPERHLYGHTLAKLGRTDDALAFWKKVLADDPKDQVAQREIEKLSTPTLQTTTPPAPPAQPK